MEEEQAVREPEPSEREHEGEVEGAEEPQVLEPAPDEGEQEEEPVRHIFRWDLDKTYLRTDFDSVSDLIKTAMQKPEEKINVPGADALLRELTRPSSRGRAVLTFISGSPEQMRKRIEQKFAIDGIQPDAFILKPQLRYILRGKFRAIRGQIGYKLEALLRIRSMGQLAPESLFETRDAVKFRLSDLTNTTSIARSNAGNRLKCHPFPITTDIPQADFYWVLDQSGSMTSFNNTIRAFASDFRDRVGQTGVDFRLGVTPMDQDTAGRLRATVGWHTDPIVFSNEIEDYVIDCQGCSGSSGFAEYGLYAAEEGIAFMRSAAAPPNEKIRANAALVTIFMSDEEANSIENGSKPDGTSASIADYEAFFAANTTSAYAIISPPGSGCGLSDGEAYRDVALATGGATASLCSNDLEETIVKIIDETAGSTSTFRLPDTPISSTLRVYQATEDGKMGLWVPRSRQDGFDYFPQTNAIAFFGTYRPRAPSKTMCSVDAECPNADEQCRGGTCELRKPLQVAVHYETFINRLKNTTPAP